MTRTIIKGNDTLGVIKSRTVQVENGISMIEIEQPPDRLLGTFIRKRRKKRKDGGRIADVKGLKDERTPHFRLKLDA